MTDIPMGWATIIAAAIGGYVVWLRARKTAEPDEYEVRRQVAASTIKDLRQEMARCRAEASAATEESHTLRGELAEAQWTLAEMQHRTARLERHIQMLEKHMRRTGLDVPNGDD